MRDLVYYVAVSIDGYIADADGGFDAFLAEGDHASVVYGEYADALPTHAHHALEIEPPMTRFDTVIMGVEHAHTRARYGNPQRAFALTGARSFESGVVIEEYARSARAHRSPARRP